MKKAICIILAVAAAMTFIVSRRPDPAAAEKFENFFKKWRTFDFALRIMIIGGFLWTSVFTDSYRQPAVIGGTVFSSTASIVPTAPAFFCL